VRFARGSPPARAISGDSLKADSILLGRVRTVGAGPGRSDAVAIVGDRIAKVGERRDVLEMRGTHTRVFEAPNGAIVPGFVDAHVHLVALARRAAEVDCSKDRARTIADLQAIVRRAARERPPGSWIRAFGYDEAFLAEKRGPSVADLDAVAPRHPVRLLHRTGHAVILNGLALRLLGLAPREVTYEPGGLLRGKIPTIDSGETSRLVGEASLRLLATGVTMAHDPTPGQENADLAALRGWANDRTIRQRLVAYGNLAAFQGRREDGSSRFFHAGVKIVIEEGSAPEEIAEAVAIADRAGAQVALHAVEGGPLVIALDALRRLGSERVRLRRHRIEHAALCPAALSREIGRAGATVVTHPDFLRLFGEKYASELEGEEHDDLYPLRSLLDAGVPLALGSDAPIGVSLPLAAIDSASRRTTAGGRVLGGSQALDVARALELHTCAGATAAGLETVLGSIEPGKLADLVLLDADPLAVPVDEVASIGVRATLVGGEVAWPT
jgi:predicted amidohydrolase YtcJ